jgi:hypothetical protein
MKIARLIISAGFLVLACVPSALLAQSQTPAKALGLVVKSQSGQIGNAAAPEGATVYSGDYLSTPEGGSLLVRIGALSLELQSSSAVHIYSTPYGAIVELNRGAVNYTTPGARENLVIVASDVRVTPVLSIPDFGRVSLDDPCNVSVYSQRGQANVQAGSESHTIEEGKAYRVRAENDVSYRKYLSPDENDYHDFHDHRPCAAAQMVKGHAPIAAGQSRFLIVSVALVGTAAGIGVWKALESPARP